MGVIWTESGLVDFCDASGTRGSDMDSIVIAARRQKSLIEEMLYLGVRVLDMLDSGRMEDVENILLLRAERMRAFAMAEATIDTKMAGIENGSAVNLKERAELHDLNLQIVSLVSQLVAIDKEAEHLIELRIAAGRKFKPQGTYASMPGEAEMSRSEGYEGPLPQAGACG